MKKILAIIILLAVSVGGYILLTPEKQVKDDYKDGVYLASGELQPSGYTATVELTISDGKISSIIIDDISEEGVSKRKLVADGQYNMGGTVSWTGQVDAIALKIISDGSMDNIYLNKDGKIDAVSSCTISPEPYIPVLEDAISQAV